MKLYVTTYTTCHQKNSFTSFNNFDNKESAYKSLYQIYAIDSDCETIMHSSQFYEILDNNHVVSINDCLYSFSERTNIIDCDVYSSEEYEHLLYLLKGLINYISNDNSESDTKNILAKAGFSEIDINNYT